MKTLSTSRLKGSIASDTYNNICHNGYWIPKKKDSSMLITCSAIAGADMLRWRLGGVGNWGNFLSLNGGLMSSPVFSNIFYPIIVMNWLYKLDKIYVLSDIHDSVFNTLHSLSSVWIGTNIYKLTRFSVAFKNCAYRWTDEPTDVLPTLERCDYH